MEEKGWSSGSVRCVLEAAAASAAVTLASGRIE